MAYLVTVTKMTTNTSTLVALLPKYRKAKHIVFRTDEKKRLGCLAKSLISNVYLVGDASFELATPAV